MATRTLAKYRGWNFVDNIPLREITNTLKIVKAEIDNTGKRYINPQHKEDLINIVSLNLLFSPIPLIIKYASEDDTKNDVCGSIVYLREIVELFLLSDIVYHYEVQKEVNDEYVLTSTLSPFVENFKDEVPETYLLAFNGINDFFKEYVGIYWHKAYEDKDGKGTYLPIVENEEFYNLIKEASFEDEHFNIVFAGLREFNNHTYSTIEKKVNEFIDQYGIEDMYKLISAINNLFQNTRQNT